MNVQNIQAPIAQFDELGREIIPYSWENAYALLPQTNFEINNLESISKISGILAGPNLESNSFSNQSSSLSSSSGGVTGNSNFEINNFESISNLSGILAGPNLESNSFSNQSSSLSSSSGGVTGNSNFEINNFESISNVSEILAGPNLESNSFSNQSSSLSSSSGGVTGNSNFEINNFESISNVSGILAGPNLESNSFSNQSSSSSGSSRIKSKRQRVVVKKIKKLPSDESDQIKIIFESDVKNKKFGELVANYHTCYFLYHERRGEIIKSEFISNFHSVCGTPITENDIILSQDLKAIAALHLIKTIGNSSVQDKK